MPAPVDSELVRLTVPARQDFVQVVRVAVRVAAGRAGCSDDARSRIQAAVGTAFFALVERSRDEAQVVTALSLEPGRLVVELRSDPPAPGIDTTSLAGVADGHELVEGGLCLQLWVDS